MNFKEGKVMPNPQLAGTVGYDAVGNPIGAADWNRGYRNSPLTPATSVQPNIDPRDFTDRTREFFLGSQGNTGAPVGNPSQGYNSGGGTPGRYTFQPRFPGQLQSQYEQLYGNAINRLNERFQPNSSYGIDPILKQAEQEYYTQTLPALRESYTRLGGQQSARFPAEIQISGQNLATNLAALRAQHGLSEQEQLMKYLNHSPYENVYEAGIPGSQGQGQSSPGLLSTLGDLGVQAGVGYLTGGPVGAGVGAASSLWNRVRNYFSPQNNQQPQTTAYPTVGRGAPGSIPPISQDNQSLLNNLSKRAAPGYQLSPQELQQIQSITGGINAGEDFARTFKQPLPNRITFPRTPQQQARFAGFNKAGVL